MVDHRSARSHAGLAIPGLLVGLLLLLVAAPVTLAAPPTNDERAGATPVSLSTFAPVDLTEATAALDDPAPCEAGGSEYRSVWFAFTPIESGTVVIAAGVGDASTSLHVLAADGTTEVGCDTESDPGYLEPHVDLEAVVGSTYLIAVTSRIDAATTGYLVIEPPIDVTLEPITTGGVTKSGAVVVTSVFHCNQDMTLEHEIGLSQGSGSSLAMGATLETHNCFAPGEEISTVVQPGNGPNPDAHFKPGQADAFIQFNAFTFSQVYRSPAELPTIDLTGGLAITPPPTDVAPTSPDPSRGTPSIDGLLVAGVAFLAVVVGPRLRRPRSRRA